MDSKEMRQRAQRLRKNATVEEKVLWYQYLRNYPIQWNRQKVFGCYIVDFYCNKVRLVIEIDGSQHYEEESLQYDQQRTEYLESLNIHVIRFTNGDIKKRFQCVCEAIDEAVKRRAMEIFE